MNKKYWGIIIIIIALLIIIGIILMWFIKKPQFPQPAGPAAPSTPGAILPGAQNQIEPPPATVQTIPPLTKTEAMKEDLSRLASAFAERFGSFSNQSDYGNIRDLEIFMTAKMQNWSREYIKEAQANRSDTSIYYGLVTKAIFSEIKRFDEDAGAAEVLVKTQRREMIGTAANSTTFYQDIFISYARVDGVWRVDQAVWQEKK